jgi:hypothetical protein
MITCRVCGTENEPDRTFCRKCASDLRPPAAPLPPVPDQAPPPEPAPDRTTLYIGIGVGIVLLIALLGILAFAFGGAPAATPAPTSTATPALPSPTLATEPTTTPSSASAAPEPTPTTSTDPAILEFEAPESVDCGDPNFPGTIHVAWSVTNATGVTISIDGPGIYQRYQGQTGSADVPFACGEEQHTYLLTTTGGTGPAATEEIVVTRR